MNPSSSERSDTAGSGLRAGGQRSGAGGAYPSGVCVGGPSRGWRRPSWPEWGDIWKDALSRR